MNTQLPAAPVSAKTKYPERKQFRSEPLELEELKSVVDTLEPRHKLEELRSMIDTLDPRQKVNVAGYPKNQLYINNGSSIHIIFNWGLLGGLIQIDQVIKIQGDSKSIHLSQIGLLHKRLDHILLPVRKYHHNENVTTNMLSFAKLVNTYYITYNIMIDDAIYVQSKDNEKNTTSKGFYTQLYYTNYYLL